MSPKQNAFQKGHQMKASWDVSYVSQAFPLKVPFVSLTVAAVVSLGPRALSAKSQALWEIIFLLSSSGKGLRGDPRSPSAQTHRHCRGRQGGVTQPTAPPGSEMVTSPRCTLTGDAKRKTQADVSTVMRIQGKLKHGLNVCP